MASALSPSPDAQSSSASASSHGGKGSGGNGGGNGPDSLHALLRSPRSLLPPLSSFFVAAHYLEALKLALQPLLFFLVLPWLLAIGAVRYYLLGGAAEGKQMASQMEAIMATKLERMSAQLSLMPAMTSQVSTCRDQPACTLGELSRAPCMRRSAVAHILPHCVLCVRLSFV